MSEEFFNGRIVLHSGDCLAVLPTLAENSIDSCVTDPPYGLGFMGREWDKFGATRSGNSILNGGGQKAVAWNATDFQAWCEQWARKVYRVLKPGAHILAFGGTRTYHRLASAIEDAGFEIRDCIQWLYGSGFPKSLDVSKAIDRAAGAEREVVGRKADPRYQSPADAASGSPMGNISPRINGGVNYERAGFVTAPATDLARQWSGFGTALKPACEPIVLARKPLSEATVAANVLRWGCGALNIDGCRVATAPGDKGDWPITDRRHADVAYTLQPTKTDQTTGRWPANVITDGSDEVVGAFPERDGASSNGKAGVNEIYGGGWGPQPQLPGYGDSGSAARFFYTSKADSDDRLGSKHPTVKPLDLMQYLCRLVTPPKGTVLDPFAGTGTTGEAAWREGFSAVLIEREVEYQNDIRRRMKLALSGPDERSRESIKERTKDKPQDFGPLFMGAAP